MSYSVLVALRAFARVVDHVDGATRYQLGLVPAAHPNCGGAADRDRRGLPSRAGDGAPT